MTKHKTHSKTTTEKKQNESKLRASYAGGYTQGVDVSRWQGNINWAAVRNAGVEIAIAKVSGSDAGDYYDSMIARNYNAIIAAGLAFGGYHFAGGTDPIHEAEYFVNGMKPYADGDVFILDWEVQHADPVGWCATFLQHVHDLCGVWPILYMNGSTFNAYNWNGNPAVANCGKWIAWYGRDPNVDLPVHAPYIMHQYSSTGSIPGIAGNVDLDAIYMSADTFKKYGWHSPAPAPTPAPTPAPAPVVTTQDVTSENPIPFQKKTVEDDTKDTGYSEVTQQGVNGVETIVTRITYTDGNKTDSQVMSDKVTTAPIDEITTVGTKTPTPEPTPTPTPTPTPGPTPTPPVVPKKNIIVTIIVAILAAIAAVIGILHN